MIFTIANKDIDGCQEFLVGDNANYEAEFQFDEEWNGKIKTARFIHEDEYKDVILDNDTCLMPAEILKSKYVYVGVFADGLTSSKHRMKVYESIKERNGAPAEPTPDVYAQIIQMLEEIEQGDVPPEAIAKAVEDYLAEHPLDGVTQEQMKSYVAEAVPSIVAEYVESHKSELKGDKGDKGDKGARGEQGIQGERGEQGERGIQGEQGIQGLPGADGKDGKDGTNGRDGQDGYTPIKGIDYNDGAKGDKGDKGDKGEDGYTPVKGVDYDTEADKEEMANIVLGMIYETIPNGEEIEY